MKIKRLTKEYAEKSIARTLWKTANSGFKGNSPWSVEQFLQILSSKSAIVLAACLGENDCDEIVGLLIASKTMVESDIYTVVVDEEYKQQKIGQQLFHYLIKVCTEKGLETIFLEVRESNTPALKLYQSLGFKEIGRRSAYYSQPTEDALMMKLDL